MTKKGHRTFWRIESIRHFLTLSVTNKKGHSEILRGKLAFEGPILMYFWNGPLKT